MGSSWLNVGKKHGDFLEIFRWNLPPADGQETPFLAQELVAGDVLFLATPTEGTCDAEEPAQGCPRQKGLGFASLVNFFFEWMNLDLETQ